MRRDLTEGIGSAPGPVNRLRRALPAPLVAVAAVLAATLAAMFAGCAPPSTERYPTLVFRDEFDGPSVDPGKWVFETGNGQSAGIPGWGNNELEYYQSENAWIEEIDSGQSVLVIEAREETVTDGTGTYLYTSARMKTQGLGNWDHGRVEARIRLPAGQGIWPAFWMLGESIVDIGWPSCGEIDIVELVGSEPRTAYGTVHYGDPYASTGGSYTLAAGEGTFADAFHTFAVEWEDGEIRWYLDGYLYSRKNSSNTAPPFPEPFVGEPFFILLNVAVGGNWPGNPDGTTQFPQRMYVDYVRVYQ